MKEIIIYRSWDGKDFHVKELCEEYERKNPPIHKYQVNMELSGWITVFVEAANEEHAKEKASCEFYPEDVDFDISKYEVIEL